MKTSDILLLLGGGAALVYFMTRPKPEDNQGGGGSFDLSGLSGLLSGLGGGGPSIITLPGASSGGFDIGSITEQVKAGIDSITKAKEDAMDFYKKTQGTISVVTDAAEGAKGWYDKTVAYVEAYTKEHNTSEGPPVKDSPLDLPKTADVLPGGGDTANSGAMAEVRNLVGIKAGSATGFGIFAKFGLPALIEAIPKIGVKTGLKFIPVAGWAYTAADVAATIYEGLSGKRIAGPWLGEMELSDTLGWTKPTPERSTPMRPDGQAGVNQVINNPGRPEAPSSLPTAAPGGLPGVPEPKRFEGSLHGGYGPI